MKNKITKGLAISTLEGVLMQVINLILQLFLARLLLPEDYGVVAILTTFINIANTFVNNGLATALLQRKNAKQVDFCTVFYVSIFIACIMYVIIWYLAPYVAIIYQNEFYVMYLRIFSISVVIGAFSSMLLVYAKYSLNFMPGMISSVGGVFAQALVGIILALLGKGVWALIFSQLAYHTVRFIILLLLVSWRPTREFSVQSLKEFFSYSWQLFLAWMIGTVYQDIFSWIVGLRFNAETLGHYSKGNSIPSMVNKVATQVISTVMFPSIAKNQDDPDIVKLQTRQMLAVTSAIIFPIMAGVAGVATEFVTLVLTEKWLPSVMVIQLMSISLGINVVNNANMQSYNAVGRADVFLKVEIFKRMVLVIAVLISSGINFHLMLISIAIVAAVLLLVNIFINKKILGITVKESFIDIVPYLVCAVGLYVILNVVSNWKLNVVLSFIIKMIICVTLFISAIIFKILPAYKSIYISIKSMLQKQP